MMQAAGAVFIYGNELEGQDITISIKTVETNIKKLDNKFIDASLELPYYLPTTEPTENVSVLPKTSVTMTSDMAPFFEYSARDFTDYDFQLQEGYQYTVVCDGKEYKTICSFWPGDVDLASGWFLTTNGSTGLDVSVHNSEIIVWKCATSFSIFGKHTVAAKTPISNIEIKDEACFVSTLNPSLIADYPHALRPGSDAKSLRRIDAKSATNGGIAWGYENKAEGNAAIAIGGNSNALAHYAFAVG
jgi:hypothetical protein